MKLVQQGAARAPTAAAMDCTQARSRMLCDIKAFSFEHTVLEPLG
jgi:hypothetical protein